MNSCVLKYSYTVLLQYVIEQAGPFDQSSMERWQYSLLIYRNGMKISQLYSFAILPTAVMSIMMQYDAITSLIYRPRSYFDQNCPHLLSTRQRSRSDCRSASVILFSIEHNSIHVGFLGPSHGRTVLPCEQGR
jgi:hypothetical protein